jgi:preprotein translocase subunit SecA
VVFALAPALPGTAERLSQLAVLSDRSTNTRLLRAMAGPSFRRADSARDERADETATQAERALLDLAGWYPPKTESAKSIEKFFAHVETTRSGLKALPAADLREEFGRYLAAIAVDGHSITRMVQIVSGNAAQAVHLWACIGEASNRCLGLTPHSVQYAGAKTLLSGRIAEMNTGEGKTLVAAMAAVLVAASGAYVHVISTNDYLAHRDCEEMSKLFAFFGLHSGFIQAGLSAQERAAAYSKPICYVSGKELVFDYLKDRVAGHGIVPGRVTELRALNSSSEGSSSLPPLIPALHFAIVDEADSVLIDEARTPMILSREAPSIFQRELLEWAVQSAANLKSPQHFTWGPGRSIEMLPSALQSSPPLPPTVRTVWRSNAWKEVLLRQALSAQHSFLRDQHYIVVGGKVQIVDESTGRVMPDRSWEQGLHQLIEVKEGLETTAGRETLQSMTFQRFFRRYYVLSGLTGTAVEASRELWTTYRLRVRRIPPNRPLKRTRLSSLCFLTLDQKWQAAAQAAILASAKGQPVLIGTRSVGSSEQIAAELGRRGQTHVVLNARQDAEEAAIVAAAGIAGRITVATNMAGRGTDIKPDAAAVKAGGLHVILTEFHESPRIDRQLIGRSARQGDAGSFQAIVATEDSLFQSLPKLLVRSLASWGRLLLAGCRVWAQKSAEHRARDARKQTLKQDRELSRTIGFAGTSR